MPRPIATPQSGSVACPHRARIVVDLAESDGFALAGGAALIIRGDVDRRTRDLDFFGPSAVAVDRLVPVAEQAFLDDGLRVQRVIGHPGFARLLVSDDDDQTENDLGSDARLFPAEERLGIRVLSGEELAVDRLLALFGRAEARDVGVSHSSVDIRGWPEKGEYSGSRLRERLFRFRDCPEGLVRGRRAEGGNEWPSDP